MLNDDRNLVPGESFCYKRKAKKRIKILKLNFAQIEGKFS